MYKALALAAGYALSYCIHTPHGRKLAEKAFSRAMRHMGAVEKDIARILRPVAGQKKEGTA